MKTSSSFVTKPKGAEQLSRFSRAAIVLILGLLAALGSPDLSPHNAMRPPQGLLEYPRLSSFSIAPVGEFRGSKDRETLTAANLDKPFTFSGWVDFPPGKGELAIVVGCDGDSYPGNGTLRVKVAQPSDSTRTINGRTVWEFSIGPFTPFRAAIEVGEELGIACAKPWQDGGTARLSVLATRFSDGASSPLTYLDYERVPVKSHDLILVDRDETPVTQGQFPNRTYHTPLYEVPNFLGKKNQTGSPGETETYYKSVYVDLLGRDTRQSIWSKLPKLKDFKKRYFDGLASCSSPASVKVDATPATYFNKGDLGIGREMHCSFNDCTKETACYVKNYGFFDDSCLGGFCGFPEGRAHFSHDKTLSREAIDANVPFATVVMVSRGKLPPGTPNKVFFAVYGHEGQYGIVGRDGRIRDRAVVQDESPLALRAPLDNRRHNQFIPGNCLVCHGAQARYDKPTRQVVNAYFLPFDVQHGFEFYSYDPSNRLSRAAQEANFKILNQIVAKTDLYGLPEARALLNGFYGAPVQDSNPAAWPSATFRNDFVPSSWNVHGDARQIYRKVVAPYCRTCHASHPGLHFGSWNNFVSFQFNIRDAVCKARDENIMPNAEATLNRFWRSNARAHLVSRMNGPGCGLEPFE